MSSRFLQAPAWSLVALLVGLMARLEAPALACASVMGNGEHVSVVDESALIVWNASAHQMDFIRRATFKASAANFGFLVPTPTQPKLSAVDDNVFTYLEDAIKPRVIERHLTGLEPGFLIGKIFAASHPQTALTGSTAKGSSVNVLETQHIAGYDAAVIAATDADALLKWLKQHGYESRPDLLSWLKPYIEQHWIITAFKISKDSSSNSKTAAYAVRMSFAADHPYFPYREPEDARAHDAYYQARSLRVFLVGTGKMKGSLGDPNSGIRWDGNLTWANKLRSDQCDTLRTRGKLSSDQLPDGVWLSAFEDHSSPASARMTSCFRTHRTTPRLNRTQYFTYPLTGYLFRWKLSPWLSLLAFGSEVLWFQGR